MGHPHSGPPITRRSPRISGRNQDERLFWSAFDHARNGNSRRWRDRCGGIPMVWPPDIRYQGPQSAPSSERASELAIGNPVQNEDAATIHRRSSKNVSFESKL